jgi:outer membrane lipoprotein-sorting protein
MKSAENIERLIKKFCAGKQEHVKTTPELDERIIADALPAQNKSKTDQSVALQPNIWRIIMRSRKTQYAAAAVFILAIIIGIVELGKPIGASAVFAAAMDSVRQARTFKCTEVTERPNRDGDSQEGEKFLFKQSWIFKEPDWERYERPRSPWGAVVNEVTITHYGKRQRLELRPVEKKALLHDMSSDYEVDNKTGELRLTQLYTDLRDRLLRTSAGAVDDLGEAVLDGKSVRVLRSRKDKRVTTVWIDPETRHPVQIEHKWPGQSRLPLLYTSIQIDVEFDDGLFSLEPPEGYTVKVSKALYPDERMKMMAKIMHVGKYCVFHRSDYNDRFPNKLEDIVAAGLMSEEAFKKVLASPDDPNGPPVIRYRRPDANAPDRDIEVVLYEDPAKSSGDGRVMVLMLTPYGTQIPVRSLEQLLKPWPGHKKKLAYQMTRLQWFCDRYAKEHGGNYPVKLADITGADIWEDTIKGLLAPWGQRDGPDVIKYLPLPQGAEPASEIMFYEIYDQWPEDGAIACYADGNCEIITDQNRFDGLIR